MLTFRKLALRDINELRPFFSYGKTRACDNTVGGAFMWRDFFKSEYAIWEQTLIFKADYFGIPAFSVPIGENPAAALTAIERYCAETGIPMTLCTATASDVADIRAQYRVDARPEPDWSDYLYLAEDLANMTGKRYHGQRNHINFFMKNFPDYAFAPITADSLPDVRRFFDAYRAEVQKDSAIFQEEQEKVDEVLTHYALYGLDGLTLRVDGQIIAFALGERQGDTVFVHAEKTDQRFRGANQMLAMEYARRHWGDGVRYVNREEDVGDAGLRASKLAYHPHCILEKFTVTVLPA